MSQQAALINHAGNWARMQRRGRARPHPLKKRRTVSRAPLRGGACLRAIGRLRGEEMPNVLPTAAPVREGGTAFTETTR